MDRIELLKTIPLFESLEADDLVALAGKLREMRVEAGQPIFHQGDDGDAMYVIEDGAVDISAGQQGKQVVLTSLFEAAVFSGEASRSWTVRRARRPRSRRATRDTLLALDRDDFVEFPGACAAPKPRCRSCTRVGERIRATNELMTRTMSRNVLEEQEDRLSIGDRVADKVASFGGSWPFIFWFCAVMAVWMIWNSIGGQYALDPLPFMFLNSVLVDDRRAAGAGHHDESEPAVVERQSCSR